MWFLTKILGFLSGGMLDRTFKYLENKQALQNDKEKIKSEVVMEVIKGEIDSRRVAADIIKMEQGSFVSSMIRPAFALPLIIYWWAVLADSIFAFKWDVLALPEPMRTWSMWIVGSYFVARPVEKLIRGYIHK